MTNINRPLKYGEKDRRVPIVQDSEVALRIQYDGSSNPIYVGRARIGSATDKPVWQIAFNTFSGTDLTSTTWPQNALGNASAEYEFTWDDRAGYTYS